MSEVGSCKHGEFERMKDISDMTDSIQTDLYAIYNWCDEQGLFSGRPGHHASRLYSDYNNSIEYFIESIRRATSDEIAKYTEEVYCYLYIMAEHDDGESIKTVYDLCPQLDEYWGSGGDGITPLGEAIVHKAKAAICAFLEVGYEIESCAYGTGDYALDLTDYDEEFVMFLVTHGAEVSFASVYSTIVYANNEILAQKMIMECTKPGWVTADKSSIAEWISENRRKEDPEITDSTHQRALHIIEEAAYRRLRSKN